MSIHPSDQARLDRLVIEHARIFLLTLDGVTPEILDRHLSPPVRPESLAGVYQNLLHSAQNRRNLPRLIGGSEGIAKLAETLCEFVPEAVRDKYSESGGERLLDDLAIAHPHDRLLNRSPQSQWRMFAHAILSGAEFLSGFCGADVFYLFVSSYDQDIQSRALLASLLSRRLHGFGFALACDFLKETGYVNCGKPDTRIEAIFSALELAACDDDHTVVYALSHLAMNAGITTYSADKLLWLVSVGWFEHDDIDVGGHRQQFIDWVKTTLKGQRGSPPPSCA